MAEIHKEDETADEAWSASAASSRRCYRQAAHPAHPLADPESAALDAADDPEDGRGNFAAVTAKIIRMEWLYLAGRGHRRALFDWPDGKSRATWMAP